MSGHRSRARLPYLPISLALSALCLAACRPALPVVEAPRLVVNRSLQYRFGGDQYEYKNGMRIMVVPEQSTNMIKIDLRFRVGSAEDPPGKAGLAHLVEHMLFEVPSAGPGTPSIETYLGKTALFYNAYTSWDETHFTSVAPKAMLNAMLFLESKRLQARCDQFDQATFQREREVVRNEVRQRAGIGAELANHLHRDVFGPNHPYHRSIGGSDAELASITLDDVCQFIARHYVPSAAILVISGNLRADKVIALADRLFAKLPAGAPPERVKIAPADLRGTRSTHRLAVEQATALIALQASRFTDYDASYDHITRKLISRRLADVMAEHEYITDYGVARAGGVRAPLTVISISVAEAARLPEAVDQVFALQAKLGEELDKDLLRNLAENARAELIASVEPFMAEAVSLADHMQYAADNRFIVPRLEAYYAMVSSVLAEHATLRLRRERSHVVLIYPDPEATPRAERAELSFSPKQFEIEDWQTQIDPAEAERDVAIAEHGMTARVHDFTLNNGLRVRLAPGLGYPVVDIRLVVPVGNLHEPKALYGLADLAADALQPGPFRIRPGPHSRLARQAFEDIMRMGGRISGSVTSTATTLRVPGMSMHADGLLWQLYWHLRTGNYPEKGLRLRKAVFGRARTADAKRARRRSQALLGALFGKDHEVANRISLAELLARVTTKDLDRFRRGHYQIRGATLIVAGEFDRADIEAEIRRLFGSLPDKRPPAGRKIAPGAPPERPVYLAFPDKKSVQTQIVLAFPALSSPADARARRRVLSAMIDLELSALRTRLGATYGAQVSYLSLGGPRMLLITAAADSQRAHEAYAAILAALERIRRGESVPAFVRARRQVLRRLLSDSLDSRSVAAELELQAITGLPASHWRDTAETVAKLRQKDLEKLIQGDLDPRRMVVAVDGKRAAVAELYKKAGVAAPVYVE